MERDGEAQIMFFRTIFGRGIAWCHAMSASVSSASSARRPMMDASANGCAATATGLKMLLAERNSNMDDEIALRALDAIQSQTMAAFVSAESLYGQLGGASAIPGGTNALILSVSDILDALDDASAAIRAAKRKIEERQ
jgi:hypothetical protein